MWNAASRRVTRRRRKVTPAKAFRSAKESRPSESGRQHLAKQLLGEVAGRISSLYGAEETASSAEELDCVGTSGQVSLAKRNEP